MDLKEYFKKKITKEIKEGFSKIIKGDEEAFMVAIKLYRVLKEVSKVPSAVNFASNELKRLTCSTNPTKKLPSGKVTIAVTL